MDKPNKPKILLAVDGSEYALEAVRYVSKFPTFQKKQIVLFNVYNKIPECYWDLERNPQVGSRIKSIEVWARQQEKELQQYMSAAKQILLKASFPKNSVMIKRHEREKGLARDILREAQQGYESVIIGRRGMSKLKDLVLGSVSAKLVEKMNFAPLFVIGNNPQIGKVLLGLDGSEGALKAVDFVGDTLGKSNFEVKLMHVIRSDRKEFIEETKKKIEVLFDEAGARLEISGFAPEKIATKIVTKAASRAGAIVKESERGGYGTIVVGRRGMSRVKDFFIGRVSNKIIQLAKEQAICIVDGKKRV
ncbi:universal stress protein [Thermodesulfobacteriota bacterium]